MRSHILTLLAFGVAFYGFAARDVNHAPNARDLGGLCAISFECKSGSICIQDNPVNGVMEGQCSMGCSATTACAEQFGDSAVCVGDVCARACRQTGDCPDGTSCNTDGWCERDE